MKLLVIKVESNIEIHTVLSYWENISIYKTAGAQHLDLQNKKEKYRLLILSQVVWVLNFLLFIRICRRRAEEACLVKRMYWPQRVKCRALFIQVKKYKALHVVQQWSNKEDSKECPPCVIFRTQLLYFQY